SPTNNRPMTAQDVVYSWKYFEATSSMSSSLANSVDPSAPIVSMNAVDPGTFAVKLAFPFAPLNSMLAYERYMSIYPVEADSKYDVRNDMRGTAAWRLRNYERSVGIEYEKNADWYGADQNLLDKLEYHILPEYASGL